MPDFVLIMLCMILGVVELFGCVVWTDGTIVLKRWWCLGLVLEIGMIIWLCVAIN
jgi:hypothetical protein